MPRQQIHHLEPCDGVRRCDPDICNRRIARGLCPRIERQVALDLLPRVACLRQAKEQIVLETLVQRQQQVTAEAARFGNGHEIVVSLRPFVGFRLHLGLPCVSQEHVRRPAGARRDGRALRRGVDDPYQRGVALDPRLRRSVRHLEDFSLARDPVRADVRPLPALVQCDHSPPSSDARPEKGELLRRCRTADDDAREAVGRRDEGRQSMRGDLQIDAVAAGHGASDGGAVIRRDHQSGNAETRRRRHLGLIPPDQHFRGGGRGGDQPGCECDRGNTEAENEPGAGDRPVARVVSAHVRCGARTAR